MTPVDAMLWTLSGVTIVGAVVLLLLPAPEECHAREEEAVHRHGQVRHVREGPQHEETCPACGRGTAQQKRAGMDPSTGLALVDQDGLREESLYHR